ncbi:hypothetical protein COO60DRAFT_1282809 [Scenedesmus sp. NREL 46B-D3]|nr:hypothetical protein COO60DRAFT_1282809 [Scenedesmus sp. NREL 46B-D3]
MQASRCSSNSECSHRGVRAPCCLMFLAATHCTSAAAAHCMPPSVVPSWYCPVLLRSALWVWCVEASAATDSATVSVVLCACIRATKPVCAAYGARQGHHCVRRHASVQRSAYCVPSTAAWGSQMSPHRLACAADGLQENMSVCLKHTDSPCVFIIILPIQAIASAPLAPRPCVLCWHMDEGTAWGCHASATLCLNVHR